MSKKIPKYEPIFGNWILEGKSMIEDANCIQLKYWVTAYLEEIATYEDGWLKLFKDPEDGLFWELTYPKGEMQGGGPPALVPIAESVARAKYKF